MFTALQPSMGTPMMARPRGGGHQRVPLKRTYGPLRGMITIIECRAVYVPCTIHSIYTDTGSTTCTLPVTKIIINHILYTLSLTDGVLTPMRNVTPGDIGGGNRTVATRSLGLHSVVTCNNLDKVVINKRRYHGCILDQDINEIKKGTVVVKLTPPSSPPTAPTPSISIELIE